MDLQPLQKIKYFLIIRLSEVGIEGLTFFIPLQKTIDKAQLTPI